MSDVAKGLFSGSVETGEHFGVEATVSHAGRSIIIRMWDGVEGGPQVRLIVKRGPDDRRDILLAESLGKILEFDMLCGGVV